MQGVFKVITPGGEPAEAYVFDGTEKSAYGFSDWVDTLKPWGLHGAFVRYLKGSKTAHVSLRLSGRGFMLREDAVMLFVHRNSTFYTLSREQFDLNYASQIEKPRVFHYQERISRNEAVQYDGSVASVRVIDSWLSNRMDDKKISLDYVGVHAELRVIVRTGGAKDAFQYDFLVPVNGYILGGGRSIQVVTEERFNQEFVRAN